MKVITIGSSPKCDIIINVKGIEPVHCQIIQDDNGKYHLVTFSKDIRLNGKEVKGEISLSINDYLSLGNINCQHWKDWFYNSLWYAGLLCGVCGIHGETINKLCSYCITNSNCLFMAEDFPYEVHIKEAEKRIKQYEVATGDTNYRFRNAYQSSKDEESINGNLLVTIVNKMILGISEWSAEELQYQRNYPQEIENVLLEMQKG